MADFDFDAMTRAVYARLEAEGEQKLAGLSLADLKDAMSHPEAAKTVQELMPLELSSAQEGDRAPDFTLPWLPGYGREGNDAFTLSDHFGRRPVALVFGSYT